MTLFHELIINSTNKEALQLFVVNNINRFHDLYNAHYKENINEKYDIREFIELKRGILEQIDYSHSQTRAFVSILFDFCERFGFISVVGIENTLKKKDLSLGKRREAAKLFLLNIRENKHYIDRFTEICELIQCSIETEEDNETKAILTFSNYLAKIIRDTSEEYFLNVKLKISEHHNNGSFPFLSHPVIVKICSVDTANIDLANSQVQEIIEQHLGHSLQILPKLIETTEEILIEQDTEYSLELALAEKSFDSIRAISVKHSDGKAVTNRGVKILESEEELYAYMRRFGNMHEAKLEIALDSLPKKFPTKVNIIDWGCGQGIASMVLLEKLGYGVVKSIVFIEPSEIAIKRAALHIRKYDTTIPIRTISKKLDDLSMDDFRNNQANTTIHLFSNILDIDDYSQTKLIELIEISQTNENYFVCVSPYIDDIKTDRLDSFKRYYEKYNNESFTLLFEETTTKSVNDEFWLCNNNRNKNNVSHGIHFNCQNYTEYGGCSNKWTRVIRVFKVNLIYRKIYS